MRREEVVVATVAVVGILIYAGIVWSRLQNRLVVTNQTQQAVAVEITIGEQTIRFPNIPPGRSAVSRFHIHGDGSFTFRGQLADGTQHYEQCGYVTNGMYGERAEFIIQPDGTLSFNQP